MKKCILFALLVSGSLLTKAQSISSDKYDWVWKQNPVIKQSLPITSYFSNHAQLKIIDLKRSTDPDIILTGGVAGAVAINFPEIIGSPSYSQAYWIQAKTKDDKTLYFRVFNEFGKIGLGQPITPGQPIKDEMFYQMALTRQLSYLYFSFKNSEDFKLHYVKKSTMHDDFNKAVDYARNAIRMQAADSTADAAQLLDKAANIWIELLKESDLKNKEARINKKVTEALYKDLIPTLIVLKRFDEAEKLIKRSEAEMGVFYSVFASTQTYLMNKLKLSELSSSPKPITLADIEVPKDLSLFSSDTKFSVPSDLSVTRTILPGSWRTVAKYTKMPAPADTARYTGVDDYWHFVPTGSFYFGKEEGGETPTVTLNEYFWDVKQATNGKYYFRVASSTDELKKNEDVKPFEILHLSLNKMFIKVENRNPEVNAEFFYYQVERVPLLLP